MRHHEGDGEDKELDVGGDIRMPAPATAQEIREDVSGDRDDRDKAMLTPHPNSGELASAVETSVVNAVDAVKSARKRE